MHSRAWIRGERGQQTLEWIALALVVLALLAALAFGLRSTEAGPGEAVAAAVSALFRCRTGGADCPLAAVGIGKAGACATRPTACLGRWGECLLQGACEGTDPEDLLGLLPWLALIGIGLSGVLRAFRPPATRPYPREVPPSPTRPPTPTPTPTPAPPDRSDPRPRQGDQRHPPATDPGLGLDQQGRKLIPYADLFVIA